VRGSAATAFGSGRYRRKSRNENVQPLTYWSHLAASCSLSTCGGYTTEYILAPYSTKGCKILQDTARYF